MDPLLAADRLPILAENAMRAAVARQIASRRLAPRTLIDDALLRFEGEVSRMARDGVRPGLLFAERNRMVDELRRFIDSRLAARLFALRRGEVILCGPGAAPFEAIVRGRRGGVYGVALRRLRADGNRLVVLRTIRTAAQSHRRAVLAGALVYDFATGTHRLLRCGGRLAALPAA